jgi:hypothetical protein
MPSMKYNVMNVTRILEWDQEWHKGSMVVVVVVVEIMKFCLFVLFQTHHWILQLKDKDRSLLKSIHGQLGRNTKIECDKRLERTKKKRWRRRKKKKKKEERKNPHSHSSLIENLGI